MKRNAGSIFKSLGYSDWSMVDLVKEAEQQLAPEGKLSVALEILKALVSQEGHGQDGRVRTLLGQAFERNQEPVKAFSEYAAACGAQITDDVSYLAMASLVMINSNNSEIQALALANERDHPEISRSMWNKAAEVWIEQHDFLAARFALERLLATSQAASLHYWPHYSPVCDRLAEVLLQLEDFSALFDLWKKQVEQFPHDQERIDHQLAIAWERQGEQLKRDEKFEQAAQSFEQAQVLYQQNSLELAGFLRRRRSYGEAVDLLEELAPIAQAYMSVTMATALVAEDLAYLDRLPRQSLTMFTSQGEAVKAPKVAAHCYDELGRTLEQWSVQFSESGTSDPEQNKLLRRAQTAFETAVRIARDSGVKNANGVYLSVARYASALTEFQLRGVERELRKNYPVVEKLFKEGLFKMDEYSRLAVANENKPSRSGPLQETQLRLAELSKCLAQRDKRDLALEVLEQAIPYCPAFALPAVQLLVEDGHFDEATRYGHEFLRHLEANDLRGEQQYNDTRDALLEVIIRRWTSDSEMGVETGKILAKNDAQAAQASPQNRVDGLARSLACLGYKEAATAVLVSACEVDLAKYGNQLALLYGKTDRPEQMAKVVERMGARVDPGVSTSLNKGTALHKDNQEKTL